MTTHYMPPSSFVAGPPAGGYMGYPGKNGGFSFRKRVERVDWRRIASVDVDTIARTLDFSTLQDNIMNITFCNLESEMDIRSVDPNFVKLFKLAQLTIEYLLHSQEYLASLCASMEEKGKQSEQETEKVKSELEALQKEMVEVKKESHKRKKLLIAQQQLMYAGNESYNKCPFCTKAFLNNSYLQSHIIRRHSAGTNNNKDGSSSVTSPDLGVGSDSGGGHHHSNGLDVEVSQIKERLLRQEAELKEEKRALQSLKNKDPRFAEEIRQKLATQSPETAQEEEGEAGGMVGSLMNEIREMNAKFQASQQALRELESRTGSKRSNLGLELEDDVENEKELLREQRSDVASHKEMIQMKIDQMQQLMEGKLDKQDRKWQKRLHQMTQQHATEMKRLNNALESTSKSMEGSHSPRAIKQRQDVEVLLRESREQEKALVKQEKMLEREIAHRSDRSNKSGRTPRSGSREPTPRQQQQQQQQQQQVQQLQQIKHSSMYPSDDEDDITADFGTGTSSLRTPVLGSMRASTMGQTGTQSLHASQFLEELRKNPTLGVMREELAALLQEHVEKKGIPQGQKGISDQVLQSKLSMLSTQRQAHTQKYPNFMELREAFNKRATREARERYRQLAVSPRGQPPSGPRRRLDLSPKSSQHSHRQPQLSATPRTGPPHPQQHLQASQGHQRGQARQQHQQQQLEVSNNNNRRKGASPTPQPRATTPQGRKTPMSTGTTTEWTSTQFDSDDDEEDDSDEGEEQQSANPVSRGGQAFAPSPGARLIQSGPARAPSPSPRAAQPSPRQGPKPRVIQSMPLSKSQEDEELDDLLQSDGEEPASPQRGGVSSLRNTIEGKLGGRSPGSKPFGGVNTIGSTGSAKSKKAVESDEDSDWDDTEPAGRAPVAVRRPGGSAGRASTDVASSNTYGTSAWGGSSSRAASTVRGDKEGQGRDLRDRRSTSRSSFASVTSVSSDDDMNLDNI